MATHSSILAWKIPWMEKPGRLQSMGSQRVGYDLATSLSFFLTSKPKENGWGGRGEGEGRRYAESNMDAYITICKIDSQWEFDV